MADNMETIAAILNKAENTDNEVERATFMRAAQVKAARMNIDLEMARLHTKTEQEKHSLPVTKTINCGETGQFRRVRFAELLNEVAIINDLKTWISNAGHWVEVTGMKYDIEVTELLFGTLMYQMAADCQDYLDSGEWRDHAKTSHIARDSFYYGFIHEVVPRLQSAKREALAQAETDYQAQGESTALVLKDKRREVSDAYYKEHPSMKRWKPSSASGFSRQSMSSGQDSGRNANINGRRSVGAGKGQIS